MILGKAVGISSVFIFILHSSNGYHENLLYHNDTVGGYRSSFGSSSSRDEGFFHDGHAFKAHTQAMQSLTTNYHPLILTPYIKQGKFEEGAEAAKVTPFVADIESYSGFLQVNPHDKSYMFFWYFPPVSRDYVKKPDTPVILWIQGGMGISGMFGALRENGPIRLEPNGKMIYNNFSWAERAHLVYFDSPVGTGYSFAESEKYPTNQREVAADLHVAVRQFLELFKLTEHPFFIAGQMYGGKTVCALGAMIHRRKTASHINFQGVAIGNGFVDPPNMLSYGKYLYQLGFIDEETRDEFRRARSTIMASLKKHKKEALEEYTKYIQTGLQNNVPLIDSVTGLVSKLNFTQVKTGVSEEKLLEQVLNIDSIKRALHATDVPFEKRNTEVAKAIFPDLLESQVHNLKLLMNNYRVLLYNGQNTIKNAYPFVLEYLSKIKWRDRKKYNQSRRSHWKVDGQLAGYFRTGGRFTELLMRNAGCLVSMDKPKWAQRMINNFIFDRNLNET